MKLLIADEDTATRNLVVQTFAESQLQITCASEGVQTWQLLSAKDPPRIVILDWILLEMNGVDICRKIRERASAFYTYIILLGARAAKDDMLTAFHAGADDYIRKPIDPDELMSRVQTGMRVLEKEEKLSGIIRGWRTMLDSLPFGVACLGHSGQLLRANMIFVELLGHDVENLLGKSLRQTVLPDASQFSDLMTNIRLSRPFDRTDIEMIRQDGAPRHLIVWGRPIPDTKDMVYQIITSLP